MKKEAGFTFLEVLMAVTIIAIMTSMIWATFFQAIRTKDHVEQEAELYHSARLVLQRLSQELSNAFLTRHLGGTVSPSSVKTIFKAEEGRDVDSITFASFSHLRLVKDAKESDSSHVHYFAEPSEEFKDHYVLYRRESKRLDDAPGEKGEPYIMFEKVKSLRFKFFHPDKNKVDKISDWKKSWDTGHVDFGNRLPSAVHIRLAFSDDLDREVVVSTLVKPVLREPLQF